jgi:CRP/FNR family cyclic AMP-dependent transcriptional regulator
MAKINYIRKVIEKIKDIGTLKIYQPKMTIITEGEESHSIFFLIEGTVNVSILTDEGKEVILNKLKAFNFFGEIGILYNCQRTASIVSHTVSKVIEIDKGDFIEFIKEENETFFMLLLEMSKRIREANRKIFILSHQKAKDRVKCYIKDLVANSLNTNIILPPHETIAKELCLSRETVTKILGDLKKEKMLSGTYGIVKVSTSVITCNY